MPSIWIISKHCWKNDWVQFVVVQCVKWSYKSWTYHIKLYVVYACKRILFQVHMCVFIHVSQFLKYYFILFCLIFILIFRVANQIPIIHMGRSRRWGCLVVWFCNQLMARLDGRTVAPLWPGPYEISQYLFIYSHKRNAHLCMHKVLHEPVCMCVLENLL